MNEDCGKCKKVLDLLKESVDQLYKVKGYLTWDQRKHINELLDRIKEEVVI